MLNGGIGGLNESSPNPHFQKSEASLSIGLTEGRDYRKKRENRRTQATMFILAGSALEHDGRVFSIIGTLMSFGTRK